MRYSFSKNKYLLPCFSSLLSFLRRFLSFLISCIERSSPSFVKASTFTGGTKGKVSPLCWRSVDDSDAVAEKAKK